MAGKVKGEEVEPFDNIDNGFPTMVFALFSALGKGSSARAEKEEDKSFRRRVWSVSFVVMSE